MSEIVKSTTGYSCPNCGTMCLHGKVEEGGTLVSMINFTFTDGGEFNDPHYAWSEVHKCQKCETVYSLENGT